MNEWNGCVCEWNKQARMPIEDNDEMLSGREEMLLWERRRTRRLERLNSCGGIDEIELLVIERERRVWTDSISGGISVMLLSERKSCCSLGDDPIVVGMDEIELLFTWKKNTWKECMVNEREKKKKQTLKDFKTTKRWKEWRGNGRDIVVT